ncbi:MAG: DUF6798 domain-containing protein, partial [Tepidisphaeraceae bacterium]
CATLYRRRARGWILLTSAAALVALTVAGWNRFQGFGMTPEQQDSDYMHLCDWARDPLNTPLDAVFLVPPQETAFRLYAQRAIVVNFKHVPHLPGEIAQWWRTLSDVIGTDDVSSLTGDYVATLRELGNRYDSRSPQELWSLAQRHGARYIVVCHDLGPDYSRFFVFTSQHGRYFVYDRGADGEP